MILRNEDLDRSRCKPEFAQAMLEDLRWFGLEWQEGPDCGGEFGPYSQSERLSFYAAAFERLKIADLVYPCSCSRQDVMRALRAPHTGEHEPVYPGTCRNKCAEQLATGSHVAINWRFKVPAGERIEFIDLARGPQRFAVGEDFGDFVVWRFDGWPSYQLAVVVDDASMQITEVVRGEDLLESTARQLLLYRALGLRTPDFYHCPLLCDSEGKRLAKRHEALSLRKLKSLGHTPEGLRRTWTV